jgi:universal stress protein E
MLAAVDPAHRWAKPAQLDTRILSMGALLSAALGGKLHAVHTFESMPLGTYPIDGMDPNMYQNLATRLRTAAAARFKQTMRGARIGARRQYLVDAPAVTGIAKVARDIGANLVVLGAVSRSGLSRVFIGSTAEMLLDRLSCDLLIVKPARFKAHISRTMAGARVIPAVPAMTM